MNRYKRCGRICLAIAVTGVAVGASGQSSEDHYDRVDLSASVRQEIKNDLVIASVFAQAQAVRQTDVAKRVNDDMQWALATARKSPGVKLQTTQYNTFPIYVRGNRITGWRARQAMRLESEDVKTLTELLGKLQEKLALESVSYAVSSAAREAVEDDLIARALARFRARAALIAKEMGRDGYRIVHMNINSAGGGPMPVPFRARAMAVEADTTAPSVEAGVQTVTVNTAGTIELDPLR